MNNLSFKLTPTILKESYMLPINIENQYCQSNFSIKLTNCSFRPRVDFMDFLSQLDTNFRARRLFE